MGMQKQISSTHKKTPEVPEKTYPHTHLPSWKPLVSICFIFTRTMTNDSKAKLQGINIVTAPVSPGQWAVQVLPGWMPYSRVPCLKGEDEDGCSGEQKY